MGRGVTLVSPAAEIALEVEEMLARQGVAKHEDREGDYRFYCTGDVETFRTIGARFLQMPLERVDQVSLDRLRSASPAGSTTEGRAGDTPAP